MNEKLRLSVCLLCLMIQVVRSSHFRGGIIMVRPQPEGLENEMEITYHVSWRRDYDYYRGRHQTWCDTSRIESKTMNNIHGQGGLTCWAGCSVSITKSIPYNCISFSETENWSFGENRISYVFSSTSSSTLTIGFSGENWILPFDSGWSIPTTFSLTRRNDTGQINSTPRAITSPVIYVQHGCNHTIPVAVNDPDGDIVRCRWAVGSECGGICNSFPGAILNNITCTFTYEANGTVGYKAAAIMIEDFVQGSLEPLSSVALQFLVRVLASKKGCSSQPWFVPPTMLRGTCVAIPSGTTFKTQIFANSGGQNVSVKEFQTTSPLGLRKSDIQQVLATNKYYFNVTWTPQPNQENQTHLFCYSAINSDNQASEQQCIQFLTGYFPPQPELESALPNQALVHPFNTTWSLSFNQLIQRPSLAGFIRFFDSVTEQMVYQIDTSLSLEVIFTNNSISISPSYRFPEKQTYYITLDRGVVNGLKGCGPGNEPINNELFWTFETIDVTPPEIIFTNNPTRSNRNFSISWRSNEEASFTCTLLFEGESNAINCSQATWTGVGLSEGSYQLEITATDLADNRATLTHSFVVDLTPPIASINQRPALVSNQARAKFSFSCSKNCTFNCLFGNVDSLFFPCNEPLYFTPILEHNKTYTLAVVPTDDVGNEGREVFYTWETDFKDPQISAILNFSTLCFEISPSVTGTPRAFDNRPEEVSVTYEDSSFGCYIQRTWTATDVAGNTGSFVQFIFLNFSVSISSASSLSFPCDSTMGTFELPSNTVYAPNPCQLPLDLSYIDSVPQFTCPGEFTRNWTAEACGSTASASQLIRFFDNCPPNACGRNESPPRGICSFGECSCTRPWFGSNCSTLIYEPEFGAINNTVLEEAEPYMLSISLLRGTPPLFWSLVSSPNNLRLNGNMQQIVWTRAQAGNHTVSVKVENEVGVSTATWTLIVRPGYTASIDPVSPSVFPQAQPVTLTGRAEYIEGNLVREFLAGIVPVSIDITRGGTTRTISTFTEKDGSFSTVFYPAPTEYGSYTARARHPASMQNDYHVKWEILGMRAKPLYVTLSGETSGNFQEVFYNTTMICGSDGIEGVKTNTMFLSTSELRVDVSLSQNHLTSSPEDCIMVDMYVRATRPLNWLFLVQFSTNQNTTTAVVVNIRILQALPKFEVSLINTITQIIRGSFSILEFTITNVGQATAHNIEPVIPDTPVFSFIGLGNSENSYGSGQFNLRSGESASLTVQAMVSDDMPLGEIRASFYIVSDEASQQIPVSLTVSSDTLMNLTIVVEDEYTYFASGEPLVSDATITIINYQRDIRTTLNTEAGEGMALFTNIHEDQYEVFIEAPNHRSLRQVIVTSLNNPTLTVFLDRETVIYRWSVTPVTFKDTYALTLESDFETHVPIPVVTVSPTDFDLQDFIDGLKTSFELNITNHGLIRADNVYIALPTGHPSLDFSVDDEALGNLEAISSVTVVVHVSRNSVEKRSLITRVKWAAYLLKIYFSYVCGEVKRRHVPVVLREITHGTDGGPPIKYKPGRGKLVEICTSYHSISECSSNSPIYYEICDDCNVGAYASGFNPTNNIGAGATFKFKGFDSITNGSCDNCITSLLACIPEPKFPSLVSCISTYLTKEKLINTDSLTTAWADITNLISCFVPSEWIPGIAKDVKDVIDTGFCIKNVYEKCLKDSSPRRRKRSLLSIVQNHLQSMYPIHLSLKVATEVLGDELWLSVGDPEWVSQTLRPALDDGSEDGVLISDTELAAILSVQPPPGTTSGDVEKLVNRLNNTLSGWNSGQLEPMNNTNMASYSFVESTTNEINRYNEIAINKGFSSYLDAYTFSANDLNQLSEWPNEEEGVCAVIRIRIEQELAITREAFLASLEIENQEDIDLERMTMEIVITDSSNGVLSTNLFAISNETLSGSLVRSGDSWTLMSGSSGSVEWLIVPLSEAAPEADQVYSVGGTLRYSLDNENITIPLLPTLITVTPDPSLLVHYFWERTVVGDDPFTEEVEPSIPFTLGVIVKNAGYGVASSLTLSSGQPEIIENEKGLHVNFMIIGANIGNGSITPSLSLTLGDLSPQSTVVIRWFMISSLQGTFKNFSAKFQNINPLGDPRLSILDELRIHELTRNVRIYDEGDDGILDFLVNERQSIGGYPDALYDSQTLTRYNVSRGEVISVQSLPGSASTLEVRTTANETGWMYYRYTDTRGVLHQTALTLNTTKQALSGPIHIPPENSWITFDNDVLMLHIVDFVDSTDEVSFVVTLCTSNCTAISIPFTRPTGTPPPTTEMVTTPLPTTVMVTTPPTTDSVSDVEGNNTRTSTMLPIAETTETSTVSSTTENTNTTLITTLSTALPPEVTTSAVQITLSNFSTETFKESDQQFFKETTAAVVNAYCSQDLQKRCQEFQKTSRSRRQSGRNVTANDVIITDIKDKENKVLSFLMYILVEGGTLKAAELQSAIQEGTKLYANAGFPEVTSQPFVSLATEAPDITELSHEAITAIGVAVAAAVFIFLAFLTANICGCCIKYWRSSKKSKDFQADLQESLLEYVNPVS